MVVTESSVRIARLAPADLSAYKRLRDEALRLYPEAFDSDIESERARPPESYLGRLGLTETLGGTFLLGAWDGRELVGMVGVERQSLTKLRHSAELNSMMVAPQHTGRGIGIQLLNAALAQARQAMGLELITLRVSTASKSAIRLYERAGFQACGVVPHAVKLVDGPGQVRYHDKLTMVMIL
ncbi:GNAT family N-acetyltransferase [Aquabacterium fontiphilum]|uniref:GNAT family N-acetyltransferase n=1 Tax=Aquabacterium fontiphilum TaxID=450365 RepID=UPI0013783601|nr:GNAT family N-acetyltransferase [Aquabacterium fontiphilum]NBD19981.1 GNAT family N-acetyltransferase [Aquabacterium fontiphilum]